MNQIARRGFEVAGAASLVAGALAGCGGEPTVDAQAQIQRYGAGVDVTVVQDQWNALGNDRTIQVKVQGTQILGLTE